MGQIPSFIGSLTNLRYLNLWESKFGGVIPPQIGNLSKLHVLSLGSSFSSSMSSPSLLWLSNLPCLSHLDMSNINLGEAIDWFQVINSLPSLVQLHLPYCSLANSHPYVTKLNNLTSLSLLDISYNSFDRNFVPQWIFSLTNLVSLDLSCTKFVGLLPNSINSFHNLTSLQSLNVALNDFMDSPLILKGLPPTLISLDIGGCGVSSSSLSSLHNLASLLIIDMSYNQLTEPIPNWLCNFCNLRELDLSFNNFANIDLASLLNSLFNCKSPSLESLDVFHTKLSGPIPYSIGRFSSLKKLSLSENTLNGSLPDSIGRLSSLERLHIYENQLNGNLPKSIGWLSSLEELHIYRNQLSGILPDSIGRLSSLKELDISENRLSGSLPNSIGWLSSLEELHIYKNQLNGCLPDSIGRLSSLETLDISENQLSGSLPDSIGQLALLEHLYISNNMLMGIVSEVHFVKLERLKELYGDGNNLILQVARDWIPPFQIHYLSLNSWRLGPEFPLWLQSQRELDWLDISNRSISSLMPPEKFWRSLPNLTQLDMSQNHMKGSLPSLFGGSLILKRLDLSNNSFIGSLHSLLCSNGVEEAQYLYLGNNRLSGVIPECGKKWSILLELNLENNDLYGEIPRTLSSVSSLELFNIRGNKISGRISTALMNLTALKILQLDRNELVGSIPSWLGTSLPFLRVLNLRSNNLEGDIPHTLCYFLHIGIVDLAHNSLFGNIPRCFNNFSVLTGNIKWEGFRFPHASETLVTKGQEYFYKSLVAQPLLLDLASNNLSGAIPIELTTLQELQSLNLSRNQLTGKIPEKIGDMKMLESLDLSLNKISGNLPISMSRLNFLSFFNVSYNNLTGRIPDGTQLQTFNESSFFGNKLYGGPLGNRYVPVEAPLGTLEDQKENNELDWELVISVVLGLVVGFWIIVAPLILCATWRIAYFRIMRTVLKVI